MLMKATHSLLQRCSFFLLYIALFAVPFYNIAQDSTATEAMVEQGTIATPPDARIPTDDQVLAQGEALFSANCTACHAVHKKLIGPAMANINQRRTVDWLIPWIQNSQKVIASGDEYAVNLYNEYGQVQMQSFALNEEEILSILGWIWNETQNPPQADVAIAAENGTGVGVDTSMDSGYSTAILILLVVVLVLILVVLILMISVITQYLRSQKGTNEEVREVLESKLSLAPFFKSNAFLGTVVFIFTAIVLKTLIDGAFTIGVQQGYQPTQPIAFSHKLHAGQYEVGCQYCHTGVQISKSANIPSANICMNCHTEIKNVGGEPGVSPQLQLIYNALDYNPDTKEYGDNPRPIEWVRVHNLPDLAYFNHSQHVAVGGLECETCHGPIEEMEVVYQYANLTMGWCINCHRETEVNADGNAYYDKLVELHNTRSKEPMTVEDIGGLECSKCHY